VLLCFDCLAVRDALEWLEDNQEAEKSDYEEKQNEIEKIVNPVIQGVYQGTNGDADMPADEDEAEEEDEL